MDTAKAMTLALERYTNAELVERTGENYNTVAAWRFKFYRDMLSLEKQIEILTKLNYQIKTNLTWKTQKLAK